MEPIITKADVVDLEAILGLQKVSYISEAEANNNFNIPPLHQTITEIKEEYNRYKFLKMVSGEKIIGSVRCRLKEGTNYIEKLIVSPLYQNRGLGSRLLSAGEVLFTEAKRFELFTGAKSARNLYLYKKNGYKPFKTTDITEKLRLVFLEKFKP